MKYIIALTYFLVSFTQANAAIIEADFQGDTTGAFTDTISGNTFIDLDKFSDGQIGSMFTQAANYGASLATQLQIEELFNNIATFNVNDLIVTMGSKFSPNYIWGYYDDGTSSGPGGQAYMKIDNNQWVLPDRGAHDGHNGLGAWAIVSQVPEPSILALMGLGIFGLGLSRRKMKK
jgi:hypothetical protein